jgi:integrase
VGAKRRGCTEYQAAKRIIAQAGSKKPHEIKASDVIEIDEALRREGHTNTTLSTYAASIRSLLLWLWANYGAPKLDDQVRHYPGVRPRNVTVTDGEKVCLLNAASAHMRLYILLCSDLAIRSGTAARLMPSNYDADKGVLRFVTKKAETVALPVTEEIRELLGRCDMAKSEPFIRQLWRAESRDGKGYRHGYGHPLEETVKHGGLTLADKFRRLKDKVGITRRITPHDLRRTTAVALFEQTGDVRDVQSLLGHRSLQSTIWYLDHNATPVKRSTLELIKRPEWARKEVA